MDDELSPTMSTMLNRNMGNIYRHIAIKRPEGLYAENGWLSMSPSSDDAYPRAAHIVIKLYAGL
jgi:hypothetical protein